MCGMSGSNWASEEILKINSPEAVVVSIAPSQIDLKPIPFALRSSIRDTKWCIERPSLSSLQTTSVSPAWSSAKLL